MLQMNEPTVEETVLGTTRHCKKVINFLIHDEEKEIDVSIWYDEVSSKPGMGKESSVVSIQVGTVWTWTRQDEGRDMWEAVRATIDSEIRAMFPTRRKTTRDEVAEKIEEGVEDVLSEAGLG